MFIPMGPWLPDIAAFQALAAMDANGVLPNIRDYSPYKSFLAVASALTARCQGAFAMRNSAGTIFNIAGDATKLYKMAADGLSFGDVSRLAGGAYAAPSVGWWDFSRFGDYVIARNGFDATQVFQAGTSTNFAALAGSPPNAYFGGILREFAVAARLTSNFNSLAWSAIGNHADWVASSTTMADSQLLPDGGPIMSFAGGEVGRVWQLGALQRMVFEGPPTIMRFDKITELLGIRAGCERSRISWEGLDFWIAQNGFQMMQGATDIVPIGEGKCDGWWTDDVDTGYLYRITGSVNPNFKVACWSYPSTSASSGTPDTHLFYHWPSGKWAYARVAAHELIYIAMAQTGYTLDTLDALNPSLDALGISLDSLTLSGAGQPALGSFNSSHQAGFHDGPNLAATLETSETQLIEGRKAYLRSLSPMVEGTAVSGMTINIKGRNMQHVAPTTGPARTVNSSGVAPCADSWKYHRAVVNIPAAKTWKHALGVADPVFSPGSRTP